MGSGEFKHITVNPSEDDDFVIHAGVAAPEAAVEGAAENAAESAAPEPATPGIAEEGVAVAASQDEGQPRRKPEGVSAKPRKRDDGYHETTLEDLKGEKMPIAQRVVIIAAVICIIGAVVYYFAFMR